MNMRFDRAGMGWRCAVLLVLVYCGWVSSAQAGTLVATTHPLYLIAKAVTAGIEQPVALLPAAASGHDITLKPSDRILLKNSDFVVWFGRDYESSLTNILEHQRNTVSLFDLKAFRRLPLRNLRGQPISGSLDPHIWLDPANAVGIAYAIAAVRAEQYPKLAPQYLHNAENFAQRLLAVAARERSNPPRAYWAYHDAYQYLEPVLHLLFAGALTSDPELPPAAGQLVWLSQNRPHPDTMCLFVERPLSPALIDKLRPVQSYPIDEAMTDADDFVLGWQGLVQHLKTCNH
jgi:zinc transport system substrate-binding protein